MSRSGRRFADRAEAGRALAAELADLRGRPGLLVLGLPRGGVPVAAEVARALGAPLDVFGVRKLGVPGHEELAMGAIATGGVRVLERRVLREAGVPREAVEEVAEREAAELVRREAAYRAGQDPPAVRGRPVVVVDDGLATGSTMRAALRALRALDAEEVVAAVPVAPAETCEALRAECDRLVCARTPEPFGAVGAWYADFRATTDDEVRALLAG